MKRLGLVLMSVALLVALSACAANATPTPTPSPMATVLPTTSPMPGATATDGLPDPSATDDAAQTSAMTGPESATLSKKANDAAAKISEIDSCVTAIIGDTCVAGVTFDPQYKGAMTDRIRDMVSSRIQSAAPVVERVAVTTDPELTAQIGAMAEKISKAGALSPLTGEFDSVLNKMQ